MSAIDLDSIESVSLSVVGQVREENQDYCDEFVSADGSRLWVVADGMGGHRGGATASKVATETIGEVFGASTQSSQDLLVEAVNTANLRVFQMSLDHEQLRGMGTTVVALVLDPEGRAWVAHVGDSRIYRLNDSGIEQLTQDHSVVGEMVRRGLISPEEASVHPHRNEILRSVGIDSNVEIDVAQVEVTAGDCFILCSDGLSGTVTDDEIASLINLEPLAKAAQSLIDLANERGGPDNITAQLVSLTAKSKSESVPTEQPSDRPSDRPSGQSPKRPIERAARSQTSTDHVDTSEAGASNTWLPAGIAAALLVVLAIYFAWGGSQ
jgi:serine/threonine protein phosphatase PrpC